MKKFITIIITFILYCTITYSEQQYKYKWLEQIGGIQSDAYLSVCTDSKGFIYTIGLSYSTELHFSNNINLMNPQINFLDNQILFIAKYNQQGSCQWAKKVNIKYDTKFGSYNFVSHTDSLNNLYFSISISYSANDTLIKGIRDSINFGNNINVGITHGVNNILVKYSGGGKCLWGNNINTKGNLSITEFCFDAENNLYITGYHNCDSINFGDNNYIIRRYSAFEIGPDSYIAKYKSDGICQWAFGTKNPDYGSGLILGGAESFNIRYSDSSIYISGWMFEPTDFGDGKFAIPDTSCIYLVKYDLQGNFTWLTLFNDSIYTEYYDLNFDKKGNIYLCGNIFEMRRKSLIHKENDFSSKSGIITELDSNGKKTLDKIIQADSGIIINQILIDKSDNLLLFLHSHSNQKITIGDSIINTQIGENFLILDNRGKYKDNIHSVITDNWLYQEILVASAYARNHAIDNLDNIYEFGDFNLAITTPEGITYNPKGDNDIFLIKYSKECTESSSYDYSKLPINNNIVVNKAAKFQNNFIRLTSSINNIAGSAFFKNELPVRDGFNSEFSFRLSKPFNDFDNSSPTGADGIAFVIQNYNLSACGSSGAGIGFEGIPNSLAIEIDTYKDDMPPYNDSNDCHIAVFSNGASPNSANHLTAANLGTSNNLIQLKADSTLYYVKIEYNIEHNVLKIYIDTVDSPDKLTLEVKNINLSKLLNLKDNTSAYLGFTAATGSSSQNQDIASWSFCPFPQQIITEYIRMDDGIKNQLNIFPNPVESEITLNFPPDYKSSQIKIYSIEGIEVLETEYKDKIDVSGFAPGVYYIKVKDKVMKFVKI